MEATELEKVFNATKSREVQVVDDFRDNRGAAQDFARDRALTYPSLYDYGGRTLKALGVPVGAVPTTVVLDRQLRPAVVYLKAINEEELTGAVERVLAESDAGVMSTSLASVAETFANTAASGPLVSAIGVCVLVGLVSFASPCVIPLVPGYLSYLAGLVGAEAPAATPDEPRKKGRLRVVGAALLFVLGFTVVYTLFTVAFFGLTGALYDESRMLLLQRIGGVVVIVMGLVFIGTIRTKDHRLPMPVKLSNWFGAPILGAVFASRLDPVHQRDAVGGVGHRERHGRDGCLPRHGAGGGVLPGSGAALCDSCFLLGMGGPRPGFPAPQCPRDSGDRRDRDDRGRRAPAFRLVERTRRLDPDHIHVRRGATDMSAPAVAITCRAPDRRGGRSPWIRRLV